VYYKRVVEEHQHTIQVVTYSTVAVAVAPADIAALVVQVAGQVHTHIKADVVEQQVDQRYLAVVPVVLAVGQVVDQVLLVVMAQAEAAVAVDHHLLVAEVVLGYMDKGVQGQVRQLNTVGQGQVVVEHHMVVGKKLVIWVLLLLVMEHLDLYGGFAVVSHQLTREMYNII
jgi:hypothetical protein